MTGDAQPRWAFALLLERSSLGAPHVQAAIAEYREQEQARLTGMRAEQADWDTGRRPKRSDVTPLALCAAIAAGGLGQLEGVFPWKVLLAAVHRDTRRGYINWGVSPLRPWLEHRGRMLLAESQQEREEQL